MNHVRRLQEPIRKAAMPLFGIAATAIVTGVCNNHASNEAKNDAVPPYLYRPWTYPKALTAVPSRPDPEYYTKSIIDTTYCEPKAPVMAPKVPLNEKFSLFDYPANNPIEDRKIYGEEGQWTYGAVFDGHGGHQVADFASKLLMKKIFSRLGSSGGKDDHVAEKIVEAFEEMEQTIINEFRPAFQAGFGEVAKVGSCVLVALQREDRLIIANCGDCRAVLGQSTEEGKYHAVTLTSDHNCRVELEKEILKREHPNEDNLIVCKNSNACYVKGRLQLTRSLGDLYLKSEEFNGNPALGRSAGRYIPAPYTPPYVSHRPDVFHAKLTKEDRFVILGSDGLWDYLDKEEAVNIVFEGMKQQKDKTKIAEQLVDRALEIAAEQCGMTLTQLKHLPQGRSRRARHDDTTAVVMFL